MSSGFFASARNWIASAGLAIAVTVPTFTGAAVAAPFVPAPAVAAPIGDGSVIQVRDRDWNRRARWYRDNYGHRNWRGDRGWRRGDGWRDGRRYYRHRDRRNYGGVALGLGLGVPLGAYLASRPAYDPYYDGGYVVRRNVRPVYRDYGGNRHTSWCYNRYRSYRAYDNSFQPYNGPRQTCYSPYS